MELEPQAPVGQVTSEIATGTDAIFEASAVNLSSMPAPQFRPMREQDLTIWSPALVLETLVSSAITLLTPAQLRPIHIRKDDRA
jgi:hypothetical protein